jgi:hypothetical protein
MNTKRQTWLKTGFAFFYNELQTLIIFLKQTSTKEGEKIKATINTMVAFHSSHKLI